MTYPQPYPKGKDIKVPFDCLWHCYTRSFEVRYYNNSKRQIFVDNNDIITWSDPIEYKPEDFENHEVQDLQ